MSKHKFKAIKQIQKITKLTEIEIAKLKINETVRPNLSYLVKEQRCLT